MHRCTQILLLLAVVPASGCASVASIPSRIAQRVTDFVHSVDEDWKTLHEIEDARRAALKEELQADREAALACELAELNAEKAALRAEQDYRTEALRADTERRREAVRDQFDESVRTKLGLNLEQRIKLGQLQVDTEQLRALMDSREKNYQFRKRLYEEALHDREIEDQAELIAQFRQRKLGTQAFTDSDSPPGSPSESCVQVVPNDCARPPKSPLREQPPRAPLRQPISPTEVPFLLPVSLEVGIGTSEIGPSAVRRLPLKAPCLKCQPCGECPSCTEHGPCTNTIPCGQCSACLGKGHPAPPPAPASEEAKPAQKPK